MKRKGMSDMLAFVVILIVGVVALAGGYFLFNNQSTSSANISSSAQTAQGEFYRIQSPMFVSGSDLKVTSTDVPTNGTIPGSKLVTKYDLNGTNGNTNTLAYDVQVTGPGGLSNVQVDAQMANKSAVELRNFYVVKDTQGNSLSPTDAAYNLNVQNGQVQGTIPNLPDGNWVLVAQTKSISTGNLAAGANIMTEDLVGSSQAALGSSGSTSLHTTITNK